jgi:hypothetical protein
MNSNEVKPYSDAEIEAMEEFGVVRNEEKGKPPYEVSEWTEVARFLATVREDRRKLARVKDSLQHILRVPEEPGSSKANIENQYMRVIAITASALETSSTDNPK